MRAALAVLWLCSAAHADPCAPKGDVWFEIDQRAVLKTAARSTTKLWANGAWRSEIVDGDGKVIRRTEGCVALKGIVDDVKAAPWKVAHKDITCPLVPMRSTVYVWKGRGLFKADSCRRDTLDAKSAHALDEIELAVKLPVLDADYQECLDNPQAKGCL